MHRARTVAAVKRARGRDGAMLSPEDVLAKVTFNLRTMEVHSRVTF